MTVTATRPSFEGYVSARSAMLLRFAYVLCGDRHLAEDMVQEVLIRAHRRWSAIEADNPDNYLKQALVRSHISWRRRRSATELVSDSIPEKGRAAGFDDSHASREELWALLGRLSPAQRSVLVLRYFEDLDDHRIAQLVGASATTVRVHAHRGLARMREMLAPHASADALARVSGLPDTLARRADRGPVAKPDLVDSVREGAARAARRRRIALGAAGAGLAAIVAVLVLLPSLWRGSDQAPPVEPSPTVTAPTLPARSLHLGPAVAPESPVFPYVFDRPEGLRTTVDDFRGILQLSYWLLDGGLPGETLVRSVALAPERDPGWEPWNWSGGQASETDVNGITATLRDTDGKGDDPLCWELDWPQDGQWISIRTCHTPAFHGPYDADPIIEELLRFARSIRPGTTVSDPIVSAIAGASLPVTYKNDVRAWDESTLDAGVGYISTSLGYQWLPAIRITVERRDQTGGAAPLVVDGHPALDWIDGSDPTTSARHTLTVYETDYQISVATDPQFTHGDRIAIYRSVTVNEEAIPD